MYYTKDCEVCKTSFISHQGHSQQIQAALVNLKTHGRLIHPNITFFYFIKNIEQKFEKHCNSPYVFDLILEEILSEHKLSFPCSTHATDIISFVVVYYIRMRMRQFSQQENHKNKKLNRSKKKNCSYILHNLYSYTICL